MSEERAPSRRLSNFSTVLNGFAVLWRNPAVLLLAAIGAAAEIFAFSSDALVSSFARDILDVGATGLGNLTAVRQVGGAAGLLALAAVGIWNLSRGAGPLGSVEIGAVAAAIGTPMAQMINAGVLLIVVAAAAWLQRIPRWRITSG